MAKQCIYCGRPLAKDDARFCNECGRSQVAPISAGTDMAAPSAIKVKLPPKEFTRDDPSSAWPETSLPERAAGAGVVPLSPAQREQSAPPSSSRMPKRPTRLTPPASPAPAAKVEVAGDAFSAMTRQGGSAPTSGPTPSEEVSTMVLPNWREELALLRKEQEQAGTASPATPEQKIERLTQEPPPLPHRSSNTPLPPRGIGNGSSPISQPRPQEKTRSELTSGGRAPQDSTRPAEPPRRIPNTPLPQNSPRPIEPLQRAMNTPLPPLENTRSSEASRRELHVKVWEQDATIQYPQVQEEKPEPGPAPAVAQNPFASVAFGAEEQVLEVEDLTHVNWQAPISPIPASPSHPPTREEKQPPTRTENRPSLKEEHQPVTEEKRPPAREEKRPPVREESSQPVVEKSKDDIEDLPTMRLAVPDVAKPESQIKVERTSTPAPKKWTVPPTDEIEDLPTRPMTASPAGPVASRTPQQPAAQQMQSGERHPEPGQAESTAPFAQRASTPFPSPGSYGQASSAQPVGQITETAADPLASRGRPAYPNAQPGQPFNPASQPPLPPGPLSSPGNTRLQAETQGPQGPPLHPATPFPDSFGQRAPQTPVEPFGQRAPQRPPAFESAPVSLSASPSLSPNVPKPIADVGATAIKKPRKKRHTGRLIAVVLLLLVLVGGAVGALLNRDWILQYFQSPAQNQPYQTYQNSTFGISLDYTQAWSVNVDQAHSVVHFVDSSRTNQVNLTMAAANGQVGDYLTQQATQQQIIGPQTASAVTIGGSSWSVLQGTVTQSGATYKIVLYATQHNSHFYMLAFLAPQVAFTHADQSNFAHMRSSFSFI